ncbi:hypothetical protein HDU85_005380 [Gaertneriomyces sp. JEL0708]|nr:hypothetical protein HDU85_005380 [Gaertneriomyces sp. JEL0708]
MGDEVASSGQQTSPKRPRTPALDEGGDEGDVPATKCQKVTDDGMQTDGHGNAPDSRSKTVTPQDDLLQNLLCGICHELLWQAVSLVPCMHTFCGGCYSDWCSVSSDCPQCRTPPSLVSRNHTMNGVVEAFLRVHPDKARDPEDIEELQKRNKYTVDSMPPAAGDDSSSDYEDEDDPQDNEDAHRCRECLQPRGDGFQCSPGDPHQVCTGCLSMFPLRTDNPAVLAIQRCLVCEIPHCGRYYGSEGCRGRTPSQQRLDLYEFSNLPVSAFRGNRVEWNILWGYLRDKDIPVQKILTDGLARISDGHYYFTVDNFSVRYSSSPPNPSSADETPLVLPESNVCILCANQIFKLLVYKWREAIPLDELPADIRQRPNCWYGWACRTQLHRDSHAEKLNHICEQTRF